MRRNLFRAVVVVAVSCSAVASAQTTRPTPVSIETISVRLTELGIGDSERRAAARVALLSLKREDLPALRDAVAALKPLGPAASGALRDIVVHVFLSGEAYEITPGAAFLGVQMAGEDLYFDSDADGAMRRDAPRPDDTVKLRAGVVISECIPGFCAYGVLVAGDVVLALPDLGRPFLAGKGDLGQTIASTPPGRRVTLRVLRLGREIDVPLVLDPRPKAAEVGVPGPFNAWMDERKNLAEEYWQTTFAPLVGEDVM